ncbi:hypothetical protein C8R46DRAFT_1047646 [Mycena filopes]|nr:hypothetical protein C8R46DRAFT_1047646 [Mycena filopes]
MGKGQFNSAQNQWLSAQLPAYIKELDAGVRGAQLTKWKQATARRALDAPEFSDLDFSQFDRTKWFLMIVRKYTNYQNQVYDKEHPAVPSASAIIKANPLLKFSSRLTGRQLFARDLHSDIVTGSKQRVADEGTNEAAAYQIVLKTMWDELDDEQRADWEAKAEDECGDVALNQKEFDGNIFLALRGLCEGGLFGDAEMLLLYAFLHSHSVHAHSVHNEVNFGGEEFTETYGLPWSKFAEHVIPRPPKHQVTIITLNDGAVIFPRIDLDTIPLGSLRYLLGEYLQMCWKLASNPTKFYDTETFVFPLPLRSPDTFNSAETLMFGEFLTSMDPSVVFHFRADMVHSPRPSRSPSPIPEQSMPIPPPPPLRSVSLGHEKLPPVSPPPTPIPTPHPVSPIHRQLALGSLSSKDHSSGTSGGAANKANKRKRQSNRGTGDGKNAGEDSGKPKKKSKTKAVAVDNQGESAGVRRSSRVVPKADNKALTSDQADGATKKKQRWKGWVEVEESEDTD